jgi:hypothetical protein
LRFLDVGASPERVGGGTDAGDGEAAGSAAKSTADPAAEQVSLEDMRNCSSVFLQTSLVSWRVM